MEINVENVLKALECCEGTHCKGASCPYHVWEKCMHKLNHDTISLIKSLAHERARSRTDIAREIFEDIGKLTCTNIEDWKIYDELKKKYMEDAQ